MRSFTNWNIRCCTFSDLGWRSVQTSSTVVRIIYENLLRDGVPRVLPYLGLLRIKHIKFVSSYLLIGVSPSLFLSSS